MMSQPLLKAARASYSSSAGKNAIANVRSHSRPPLERRRWVLEMTTRSSWPRGIQPCKGFSVWDAGGRRGRGDPMRKVKSNASADGLLHDWCSPLSCSHSLSGCQKVRQDSSLHVNSSLIHLARPSATTAKSKHCTPSSGMGGGRLWRGTRPLWAGLGSRCGMPPSPLILACWSSCNITCSNQHAHAWLRAGCTALLPLILACWKLLCCATHWHWHDTA